MSELLDAFLAKPTSKALHSTVAEPRLTRRLEVKGDAATIELKGETVAADLGAAADALRAQGLDPAEWEVTGYRSSSWTMANGQPGESARFTFVRKPLQRPGDDRMPVDELVAWLDSAPMPERPSQGRPGLPHTLIVALGDMQFGKIDGDGVEGSLTRTVGALNNAYLLLDEYRRRFTIDHVHVAWLGDHVEGFVSQSGANTWRTQLTLNEQIRLTRRVMLHAMALFAPEVERLTMTAVPGNHGEAVRLQGKGLTRYDDSHDTEALIALKDAADLAREDYGHVEFVVPDTDELTTVVDCSGTVVAHAHGHQWRPGKHFDWWRGQAFSRESAMHDADVLLAGHLHHELIEADGPRTFIQVPSLESESTWWRHRTGSVGAPGLIVAITRDGRIPIKEVVS